MAKKRVTFRYEDTNAKSVAVSGSFNAWEKDAFMLKKGKGGVWSGTKMLEKGRYEYRLFVNNEHWIDDPAAAEHVQNEFGGKNAVLNVA